MKYYDTIGFWVKDEAIRPGVTRSKIVEKKYAGDVLENRQRWTQTDDQNDDLVNTNRISIIGDLYLSQNMSSIKYANFMGVKWKVKSLDVTKYPRIVMELGGVYNGINTGQATGTP